MELFCRKRSCSDSSPAGEVTVKRCASCPEYCKPPIVPRVRGQKKPLLGLFHTKKSTKQLSGVKWNSYDDVSLRAKESQLPETLGQVESSDLIGCKIFTNPIYQTPVRKNSPPTTSQRMEEMVETMKSSDELPSCMQEKQNDKNGVEEQETTDTAVSEEPNLLRRLTRKNANKWKRKQSKFVHTQPLYQDYWVHCEDGDPGVTVPTFSLSTPMKFASFISTSLLRGTSCQERPRDYTSSLWQDLSEVKSRCILERINPQQKHLQEAIFEVVTSEASYQRSLSVAVNHFLKSRKLSDCLASTDKHTLFSNLPAVREVSERFLLDLEDGLERDIFLGEIGDLVLRHCPAFQKVYIPYVTNQMYQEKLMQHLVRENAKFLEMLRLLEEQPVCKRQLLKSFLVLPFQRITRLKILLENILKLIKGSCELEHSVSVAVAAIGQIVTECNEGVRSMMQTEELVRLEKQVAFLKTKSFPLISRGRVLVQHGELVQIFFQEAGAGNRLRLSTKPLYVHLFSDLLLLSSRTDDGRFLVADYAGTGQVKVDQFKAKPLGLPDQAFMLRLLRNHAGLSTELILEARSLTEKQQWMSLISKQMSHRPS